MFDGIDLSRLFNTESEYGKDFVFGELTEEMIKRAEKTIGYEIPKSYIALLKQQNGGIISDEFKECWLTTIYGIGPEQDSFNGLEEMFENWIEEWEYPNIGIPFGETESAGHDMYFMDFRNVDASGEPAIVRIENECAPEDVVIFHVADNLEKFIEMIFAGENVEGIR